MSYKEIQVDAEDIIAVYRPALKRLEDLLPESLEVIKRQRKALDDKIEAHEQKRAAWFKWVDEDPKTRGPEPEYDMYDSYALHWYPGMFANPVLDQISEISSLLAALKYTSTVTMTAQQVFSMERYRDGSYMDRIDRFLGRKE